MSSASGSQGRVPVSCTRICKVQPGSLKRFLPTQKQLRQSPLLGRLHHLIFAPDLWQFNRRSVSRAAFLGVFCCFMPIPLQMLLSTLLSIRVRANLPLATALVWISNPITMPALFYLAYRLGCLLLDQPAGLADSEFGLQLVMSGLLQIWLPLLLGCFVCGLTLGSTAFFLVHAYWRWRILRYLKKRAASRKKLKKPS